MKLLRKLFTMMLYAFLLLPGRDYRIDAGLLRAVEIASTALDRTMRRRKSRMENDRFTHHIEMIAMARQTCGDQSLTLRLKAS